MVILDIYSYLQYHLGDRRLQTVKHHIVGRSFLFAKEACEVKKFAKKSVLVAEDHPDGRKLIVRLLEKLGVSDVVAVTNGAEALNLLQDQVFDLLIVDWHMPTLDGLGVLQAVKADDTLKPMKVLMVTADDDKDHVLQAILAGADGYLVKPVTEERLQQKLEDIFKDE